MYEATERSGLNTPLGDHTYQNRRGDLTCQPRKLPVIGRRRHSHEASVTHKIESHGIRVEMNFVTVVSFGYNVKSMSSTAASILKVLRAYPHLLSSWPAVRTPSTHSSIPIYARTASNHTQKLEKCLVSLPRSFDFPMNSLIPHFSEPR